MKYNNLYLILLIPVLLFCVSCGTRMGTESTSESSTDTPLASCNKFQNSYTRGILTAATSDDMVNVLINQLPSDFDNTSSYKIKFFRVAVDSSNQSYSDSVPLQFRLEVRGSNNGGTTGYATELTPSNYITFKQQLGLTASTAQQFLNQAQIAVAGLSLNWQIIQVVIYKNGRALSYTDSLAPQFLANIDEYIQSHPRRLNELHPFYNLRGHYDEDAANAQFSALAQSLCY